MGATINNCPNSLDLSEWISWALNSSEEIDRLLALEELKLGGENPELSAKTKYLAENDSSYNCRLLAKEILLISSLRAEVQSAISNSDLTPQDIRKILQSKPISWKVIILRVPIRNPGEHVLNLWREFLVSNKESEFCFVGLHLLARFGSPKDVQLAQPFLAAKDDEVICSALEVLHSYDISDFKEKIPIFLNSRSLTIRLKAIRLLRDIDSVEAMKFISALLRNRDPLVRQKALRELLLVPDPRTETVFLQFLSSESNPFLLAMAGIGLAMNPNPNLPIKLVDIIILAKGLKRQILQITFKHIVENIQAAGLLNQPVNEYFNELARKVSEKQTRLKIKIALRQLENEEINVKIASIRFLLNHLSNPEVSNALKRVLENETNDEVKELLNNLFKLDRIESSANLEEELRSGNFFTKEISVQRKLLQTIKDEVSFNRLKAPLKSILKNSPNRAVLIETIQLFSNWGKPEDAVDLLPLLKHSEPGVISQTIKALGKLNIDIFLPYLNKFIADENPLIKTAAMEVFIACDKESALQQLKSMIKSPSLNIRRTAVSLIPHLDSISAQPLLEYMLENEPNDALRIEVGFLLAADINESILWKIYKVSHDIDGKVRMHLSQLWDAAVFSFQQINNIDRAEIERKFLARLFEDTEAAKKQPTYAFRKVTGKDELDAIDTEELESSFLEKLYELGVQYRNKFTVLLVLVATLLILFLFIEPESEKPSISQETSLPTYKHHSTFSPQVRKISQPLTSGKFLIKSKRTSNGDYSKAIRNVEADLQEIRRNMEEYRKQKIIEIIEKTDDPIKKMEYELMLYNSFNLAREAFNENRLDEAEELLKKIIIDSSINSLAKVYARQMLLAIAVKRKNFTETPQLIEEMFQEIGNLPNSESIKELKEFAKKMKLVMEYGEKLNDPEFVLKIKTHWISKDGLDASLAEERIANWKAAMEALRTGNFFGLSSDPGGEK